MKTLKKIFPMVLAVVLGVAFFYGMAHANNVWFGAAGQTAGIGIGGTGANTGNSIMGVIKSFLNWVLWLLSLIALVVLLYGGFNMVTAAGDEAKYKKGFKVLQQAAVGLAIIGLSWLIVSSIFWIIGATGGAQQTVTTGTPQ